MATIPTDMGFELTNTEPLDPRLVREDIAARDALVTNLQAYESMEVYVKSEKKKYKYTGTAWEEVGSGSGTAIDDTQASDTTTYSSNKIADLIAEATMGKDLGNLLIVKSSADMSSLATKDNLGKSALYIGNSTNTYAKGEIYELYWDAININYISFAYSPIIKFNFTKIQEILGTRTSLTVTGEYGYQNQKDWRITTDMGMAGGSLGNYGIIPIQDTFAFGDKFKYTYDGSKKNTYRWLPTGNVPTWNLTKAWYNIDRFIMYNGTDGIYKKGRVYRLTGDKVTVSTNSTEISNLAIDKDKFLNNCSLRGDITFKWMNSEGYFALSTNGSGDAKTYTKKQFNSWGITYDGDITIGNNYIKIVTNKDTSINNWEWKDVTDTIQLDDTYKTLTTTNNVFGTHGAKTMYDELVAGIGAKANQTDFDTHKDDTTIHITQDEKDSYALKTEVLAIDKVQTTTGFETIDTVYSSKLTKDELDKKVNVEKVEEIVDNKLTEYDDNDLVDITSSVTINESLLNITYIKAFRKGNMAYLEISGKYLGSSTTSTQHIISNLPSKYRPSLDGVIINCLGFSHSPSTGIYSSRVLIYKNGNIIIGETDMITNSMIRFGLTYIV